MSSNKYIVECGSHQSHEAQVRVAFTELARVCTEHGIADVILVVPKKGGWETTIIATLLGTSATKALMNGTPVPISSGIRMTLESAQNFRGRANGKLIVGGHIAARDMTKLKDAYPSAMIYLPWGEQEGREWQETWVANTLGKKTWLNSSASLPAPVEKALRDLTDHINLSTGLGHPSDKEHAKRVVAGLQNSGELLDPEQIKSWALRNQWSTSAAEDLAAIVRKSR